MSLVETDIFGTTEDLVAQSIALIKEYEPPEGYRCCFSGGKDSIVVYDLIKKAGVKHDTHMYLTSVDPPELIQFVKNYYPHVIRHRPKISMFQLILKKKMLPTRRARFCCDVLKEYGRDGRTSITGIRWEESSRRKLRDYYEEDKKLKGTYLLHPIINWASDEIWEYIKSNKLPYPSLYDEGFHRIGCIGCPMGTRQQRYKEFKRWPQFYKAYNNTIHKLVEIHKNRSSLAPAYYSPETLWAWWMEEMPREDKNQTNMFEGRTP